MPDVKRTVRLITEQNIIDKPSEVEGFPQRSWHIEVWLVNEKGALVPANIFDKVTYHLHPSFGERATQVFKQPPFRIQEEGWGEFDMSIELTADKSYTIQHDLNFAQTRYESKHVLVDMDKLADGLQKLNEDDLLQVVQMVHDHKAADSYTKNDVELGEFHVDLYTLPDVLIKMLWEFTADRGAL
ncbi:Transcription initiation factor subunit (TAF30), putative [Penicillium digitatum PHI26]|uniref:Transcription initiation factor subunit (TAF30), putative n=2 Tax=Penicillium digitatum TaxID=36651 RepID=K9GLM4_PEND2|nr:Transcription initiation factor subunit (TAF30), putative [Penicillium digitatum Pd1]EKV10566.1 Transcription initiation factor subunit (TAF30), putative [Penicillium digitatum Pd1]EKV15613.1 Transcription initiation factor subunit (TAF30), putative [Penicillium digitatum PHI26]